MSKVPIRVRQVLSVLFVVAVLLAGCSGDTATTVELPPDTPEWLVQGIQRTISEDATEAQQLIFEDGVVTAAEREAAYLAYLDCLEVNGIEVLSYQLKPDGDQIHTDSVDLSEEADMQIGTDCRTEHYDIVGIVFVAQNAPTAKQEAEWWREAGECMRELGHDVPDNPNMDDLFEIAPFVASDCYDEAAGLR